MLQQTQKIFQSTKFIFFYSQTLRPCDIDRNIEILVHGGPSTR